jgi:hypothetical protein
MSAVALPPSVSRHPRLGWSTVVLLGALGCGALLVGCEPKVPIVDIGATFVLADATWFEEEETLFVFYRVDVAQGLAESARMELGFVTDTTRQDPQPLRSFPAVHEHLDVDCGAHSLCGSWSLALADEPREMVLQLRYHEDGALTLAAPLSLSIVKRGPAHTNRSAIVYGVFDEDNTSVQWRLRHQFPAIRNPEATALGLRRRFEVKDATYGAVLDDAVVDVFLENPLGYGAFERCPALGVVDAGLSPAETTDRAIFATEVLPVDAGAGGAVCGLASVDDAVGVFSTMAVARKNPQVAPAFPRLRSPIAEATSINIFLERCLVPPVDVEHRTMQLQRLLMTDDDVVCIDDFRDEDFAQRFAQSLQERIDALRVDGNDMVLRIGLNRPSALGLMALQLERVLSILVDEERLKSSPRLAGAFVFDSASFAPSDPLVSRHVVWCPSDVGGDFLDEIPDTTLRNCATQELPPLRLGPLSISSVPIFPNQRQFRNFVDRFGVDQAGRMNDIDIFAPIRTPISIDVEADGVIATFFNNEAITTDGGDTFSFCSDEAAASVVFVGNTQFADVPVPLELLPEVHAVAGLERYELGLRWDSPFLVTFEYEVFAAFAVTAAGFTVPFGIASPAESFEGSELWLGGEVDLRNTLLQCDRFCRHPTFDSAGVYNALSLFDETYRNQCYTPRFPQRTDGGFPDDP